MAAVVVDHLRKVYPNGFVAVADATFEVADGEFLVLVGPSGCGKSTVLRMIAGIESITAGTVSIGGRIVNDVAPRERDIAMVFQNYALYPHMTVAENLGFALKMRGTPRAEIERRVRAAAETLGIGDRLDAKPAQLSGGQRQRVALGRALVREPAVFLLDEPLSNLDAAVRLSTRVELARLHRRLGATMVYVTHDQVEAMTLGQRIVVMQKGEIQQIDTPMRLYAAPVNLFVARFLGSPTMNTLRGKLAVDDGLVLDTGNTRIPLGPVTSAPPPAIGRDAVAGIRPEDVVIVTAGVRPALVATADVVEPVGSETWVHLRSADGPLTARLPGSTKLPESGVTLGLAFRPGSVHLFDAESGRRISGAFGT